MATTESETQHVISNLRACLLSVKGGIPIQSLDRDYRILIGQNIPFRKLGFDSLEKFLKSIPNVSISRSRTGEVILDAIPSKSTKHLADLISRQKSAPKKIRQPRTYRTAASCGRPPPYSSSSSSSRRNFDDSSRGRRAPLSVTVNNVGKGQHSEKADRTVRVSQDFLPPPPAASSRGRGVSQPSRPSHTFELPPRFMKLSLQDSSINVQSQAPVPPAEQNIPPLLQQHSSPVASPTILSPATSDSSQGNQSVDSYPGSVAFSQQAMVGRVRPPLTRLVSPVVPPSLPVNNESMRPPLFNGSLPIVNYPPLKARSRRKRYPEVPRVIPIVEKELGMVQSQQPNYREELRRIGNLLKLGEPSFSVIPRFPNGGDQVLYGCIVKLGDHSYNSYPEEHPLPGEAAQVVAQIAVDDLKRQYESALGMPNLPETCDKDVLMKRIAMIVTQYPNGVWSTQIPVDYKKKYFELLPAEWVSYMADCKFVTMDHVVDNRIIISPNEHCIDLLNSLVITQTPTTPTTPEVEEIEPEPLKLPSSDNWDVYVTCATSTAEVWIRLIGDDYSVLYENMALDMEMLYADNENIVAKPQVGSFYALAVDGCWHRVRVESITDESIGVFFIDHGDMEDVDTERLHVLEPQFMHLPPQAVQCSLHGLEDFVEDPNASTHLIDIVGKALVAEVTSRGNEEDPSIRVILYDTSSEDDINLNQMLIEMISKEVNAPQLPQTGDIVDAHISHITDSGDLYVQINCDTFNYLETLIRQVIETSFTPENLKRARNHKSSMSKLYLAKYSVDDRYYRAKIVEVLPSNEVKVFFVDYGNTEIIPSSELLLLEVLSETLEQFPHQAIKVNLYNVPVESFNSNLLERIHELLPESEPVLIKMMELSESVGSSGKLPMVEVFRRICDTNQLISINNSLLISPDFKKPLGRSHSITETSSRSKKPLERLRSMNPGRSSPDPNPSPTLSRNNSQSSTIENGERVPPRGLCAPAIPDIHSYFDVHVTMAANPSNFTVQPYTERHKLEELMTEIQNYYCSWPCPIRPPNAVMEGGLYAAQYDDGYFYRVCVSNLIGGNMVSVYFSDFGDFAVLSQDKLQPLADRFKELPYQAIKAKLSGIQPSHSDWSVEDCLRFQERVVEHVFVSIVMERGPDLLNPSDTCLGLQLIDTTGDKDIRIDQLLVDEGRAVFL